MKTDSSIVDTVAQFIPIVLLLFSFTDSFAMFSHSILGRLLAVGLVIFYTGICPYIGAVVCLLIIVYYQDTVLETWSPMESETVLPTTHIISPTDSETAATPKVPAVTDPHTNYTESYSDNESTNIIERVRDEFRKEHCDSGDLQFKGMRVQTDMIPHVFPEVAFPADACNPCLSTCKFTIVEEGTKAKPSA
jgi:hypothetical protein